MWQQHTEDKRQRRERRDRQSVGRTTELAALCGGAAEPPGQAAVATGADAETDEEEHTSAPGLHI